MTIPIFCSYDKLMDLKGLKPNPQNNNIHPDEQIRRLAKLIKNHGWRIPITVSNQSGFIVRGHGKWMAAKFLGIDKVPVDYQDYENYAKELADLMADNKIPELSYFDDDLTKNLFSEIQRIDADFDMELTGFGDDELKALLGEDLGGDEDNHDYIPEPPIEPKSKLGDLFQLGRHRILCGDSTCKNNVEKLLNNKIPILMVTDPPYGVKYDPEWRNGLDKSKKRKTGKVTNDDQIDWSKAYLLYPGNVMYIWHAGKYSNQAAVNIEQCGFEIISQIIWNKSHFVMSRGDYHWKHEPCWYAIRKGKTHNWQGARDQSTVWDIRSEMGFVKEGDEEKPNHSTQKPVECMRIPILNNSSTNDLIYDPFLGSGSTLIACEKTDRICYGLELEPIYIDVIIQRWENYTGKMAKKL